MGGGAPNRGPRPTTGGAGNRPPNKKAAEADEKLDQVIEEEVIEKKEAEVFTVPAAPKVIEADADAEVEAEEETPAKELVNFDDLPVCDKLKEVLKMNGYEQLTNIQRNAIPVILKNQNTILKSETGSGKTLAYLVPLIEYLSHYSLNVKKIKREDSGTMAILFAPTRELAVQIDIELRKLLKLFYYMVCTTLMGGESPKTEKARLRKGCVILICTPGRFLYHL